MKKTPLLILSTLVLSSVLLIAAVPQEQSQKKNKNQERTPSSCPCMSMMKDGMNMRGMMEKPMGTMKPDSTMMKNCMSMMQRCEEMMKHSLPDSNSVDRGTKDK